MLRKLSPKMEIIQGQLSRTRRYNSANCHLISCQKTETETTSTLCTQHKLAEQLCYCTTTVYGIINCLFKWYSQISFFSAGMCVLYIFCVVLLFSFIMNFFFWQRFNMIIKILASIFCKYGQGSYYPIMISKVKGPSFQ